MSSAVGFFTLTMQRRALSAAKFAGKWRVMCTESGHYWTIAYDEHFNFYLKNAGFYAPPYLKNNAAGFMKK